MNNNLLEHLALLEGSIISEFTLFFEERLIKICFNFYDKKQKIRVIETVFNKVLRYKFKEHGSGDFTWEKINVAGVHYIPYEKLNITKEEKKEYNFLIEGDDFDFFIYSYGLKLNGQEILYNSNEIL